MYIALLHQKKRSFYFCLLCWSQRVCARPCACAYLRFLRKDAGSLASSVLTRPNSCMTLSSCLRSSWPFSRNMNSWPLLPAEGATDTHKQTHRHTQPSGTRRRYAREGRTSSEGRGCLFRCLPMGKCGSWFESQRLIRSQSRVFVPCLDFFSGEKLLIK